MGGQVRFVVRFEDGSVERRSMWTNSTSYWLTNMMMVNDPEGWMRQYVDPKWFEAVPERVGGTLAPDGYGLIVVDLKLKKLTEMQGYTKYGMEHVVGLSNSSKWVYGKPGQPRKLAKFSREGDWYDGDWSRLDEFWRAGRILGFRTPEHETIGQLKDEGPCLWKVVPPAEFLKKENPTVLDMYRWIEEMFGKDDGRQDTKTCADVLYDMSPWVIADLNEDASGIRKFWQMLRDDGFELTDEENAEWKTWLDEWIANHGEDEEDEPESPAEGGV